ncbi:MAG: phosphate acetyltransferase [Acidobacteriota bacterium]|nr:phosphate acetyltransferase [Acidobacteriota bacterium]
MEILEKIKEEARNAPQHIVLFEGEDERVLAAAEAIEREDLAHLTLLGNPHRIHSILRTARLRLREAEIIDPETSPLLNDYADRLFVRRAGRGMTPSRAMAAVQQPACFAGMMVDAGAADGVVGGASTTTADTTRAMLLSIGKSAEAPLVSSFHLMVSPCRHLGSDGAFLFADCAVVPSPSSAQLADIALSTVANARRLLSSPLRVAMLSFSTLGSARHRRVEVVREATTIVSATDPSLNVDGEIQLDAAIVPAVARRKAPFSTLDGRANVLIFPDLEAGNIGYKMAERLGGCAAVGPIYLGLAHPASDLSRGCERQDVVHTVALTALEAIRMKNQAMPRLVDRRSVTDSSLAV